MPSDQRTLRSDARRNREQILASAGEIFARRGPEAQMDEIAAHAGLGIGTLYRHFSTKEALFTAMVRDRFREIEEMVAQGAEIADPLQALTTIMRRSGELVEGDTAFQLAIMGPEKLSWDGIDEQVAAQAETIKRVIDRAVEAGVVRDDFSYNDYLMIMCGITATMYYKPGNADWRRYLELVIDGLSTSEPDVDG